MEKKFKKTVCARFKFKREITFSKNFNNIKNKLFKNYDYVNKIVIKNILKAF